MDRIVLRVVLRAVLRMLLPAAVAGILVLPAAVSAETVDPSSSPAATPSVPVTPDPGSTEPSFSVDADRESGRPGDRVRVSFASNDPGWVITGCLAGFAGPTQRCLSDAQGDYYVDLPVPGVPGSTSISWILGYSRIPVETRDGAGPSQTGTISFLVLPPPVVKPSTPVPGDSAVPLPPPPVGPPVAPPQRPVSGSPGDRSLPIGIPLLVVAFAAAALAAALIARRLRAAGTADARRVRVVPHGQAAFVTVREAPPHHTHVVGLEPRPGGTAVHVREGAK